MKLNCDYCKDCLHCSFDCLPGSFWCKFLRELISSFDTNKVYCGFKK
jgi:hypothetical protein